MALVNNYPEAYLYTKEQLAAFINESPLNFISFCTVRNPYTVYQFILRNYPAFGRMGNQGWLTQIWQDNMVDFLNTQYNTLPPDQQKNFLYKLGLSLPNEPETISWASPKQS